MLKVSKLIGHCTTVLMNMMMTIADMNGDDVTHCCLTNQLIKALGIQLSSHLVLGIVMIVIVIIVIAFTTLAMIMIMITRTTMMNLMMIKGSMTNHYV